MSKGFVYILLNPSYKSVKIGLTREHADIRAMTLSKQTGVPCDFVVAYEEKVDNCEKIEGLIHERFKHQHHLEKEFF